MAWGERMCSLGPFDSQERTGHPAAFDSSVDYGMWKVLLPCESNWTKNVVLRSELSPQYPR